MGTRIMKGQVFRQDTRRQQLVDDLGRFMATDLGGVDLAKEHSRSVKWKKAARFLNQSERYKRFKTTPATWKARLLAALYRASSAGKMQAENNAALSLRAKKLGINVTKLGKAVQVKSYGDKVAGNVPWATRDLVKLNDYLDALEHKQEQAGEPGSNHQLKMDSNITGAFQHKPIIHSKEEITDAMDQAAKIVSHRLGALEYKAGCGNQNAAGQVKRLERAILVYEAIKDAYSNQ